MTNIYKVVKIISDYELVVNAGSNKGIQKDDQLEIFIPGEELHDPESGDSLGTLDFIKSYLNVKHVYPKMCICENFETRTTNILSTMDNFLSHEVKRLNVDTLEISGGLSGSRKIKIGDLVRKS